VTFAAQRTTLLIAAEAEPIEQKMLERRLGGHGPRRDGDDASTAPRLSRPRDARPLCSLWL